MFKNICQNLILISIFGIFLPSCANKNENFDIGFVPLNKSKVVELKDKDDKDNKNKVKPENKLIIKDLVPLKSKQEILSKVKFGKKDPFSERGVQSNKLNLKLKGFLNTETNKYVFVSYLKNEGTISEGYIGGIDTNLLPNGAKVISIDPKKMKLTIYFENKNFVLEM